MTDKEKEVEREIAQAISNLRDWSERVGRLKVELEEAERKVNDAHYCLINWNKAKIQ